MAIVFYLIVLVIFLACVAMVGLPGLWHALLTFFNVLVAAVLAMNFFEPAATWIDSKMPSFSYLVDILVLWGLFAIIFSLFRLLTDFASKVKVKFLKPVDLAGGVLMSLWTAWILVSFTITSLHVAPLARNSFGGAFQKEPQSKMLFSLAPDRSWLAFMHRISQGAFAKEPPQGDPDRYVFDPEGKFILTYAARRATFETTADLRVNRTWGSGVVEKGSGNLGN